MSSGPFINPADHTPGVKIGHDQVVFNSYRYIMETLKKSFSHVVLSLYIYVAMLNVNPDNHAPGAQNAHSMGIIFSHRRNRKKNFLKSPLKP